MGARRRYCAARSLFVPAIVGLVAGLSLSLVVLSNGMDGSRSLRSGEDLSQEHAGAEHTEEEGEGEIEEEEERKIVTASITCIVLILILLTIAFEKIKESIEESVNRSLKPIIQSLFGEITVLGFLSLFTFIITKLGVFDVVSVHIFGEEGAEELLELFESVHFALFFVMVLFVAKVLGLVSDGILTEAEWLELDRSCRDEEYIKQLTRRYIDARKRPQTIAQKIKSCLAATFPSLRSRRNDTIVDQLNFYAMRREFILERSVEPPFKAADEKNRVPEDFNFGRYLSISLGQTLAHSVHLGVSTWLFIGLFTVLFFFVILALDEDIVKLSWAWTGVGFIVLGLNLVLDIRLEHINRAFAKFEASADNQDPEKQALKNTSFDDLPSWCSIDLSKYMIDRSSLKKWLSTTKNPNRQDTLFWFERQGPKKMTMFFQTSLLFNSIYGAIFLITFAPAMYRESKILSFALYSILSSTPMILLTIQQRHIAAQMTQAITVGIHRKPQIIGTVCREEKTARVVRGFIVVNQMVYKAEHGLLDKPIEKGSNPVESLSAVERADIEKTFDGFDTSGDGSISANELGDILEALGAPVNEKMLQSILNTLDEDGNGKIIQGEFVSFYARHVMSSDDTRSTEEKAHHLFKMFDSSGDKDITIGELKGTLDAFNYGFTVDEIGELIQELDEDGQGSVGEEEFCHLLHKYEEFLKPHKRRELSPY